MEGFVSFTFVALTLLVVASALVWQVRDTWTIQKSTKWETADDKKRLLGSYLMSFSLAGFWVSYVLNVAAGFLTFVKLEAMQHAIINGDSTVFACFSFLAIYFISRFVIVPKDYNGRPLLKAKI